MERLMNMIRHHALLRLLGPRLPRRHTHSMIIAWCLKREYEAGHHEGASNPYC